MGARRAAVVLVDLPAGHGLMELHTYVRTWLRSRCVNSGGQRLGVAAVAAGSYVVLMLAASELSAARLGIQTTENS